MKALDLKIQGQFAIIKFDQPDSKVNVLSTPIMGELKGIVLQLQDRRDLKGVLILSGKPDIFIAGADIKEIEGIVVASDGQTKAKQGQEILNGLERLRFPAIALINGACLGGGLELALACDYRLACFGEKVKLGLPEVKLGVIPGFGGTKRLPRIVGLRKGLELIISGGVISGSEALKIGLVDGLTSQDRLLEDGIEFLRQHPKKRKKFKPRLKGLINVLLDKTSVGRSILKSQSRKIVLKTTKGHYPAPFVALDAVVRNYSSPLKAALKREARSFGRLVITDISKNLISVFYLLEKYKKQKWVDAKPNEIHKCAVLGAGVMGGGIAQLFSFYGLAVRMRDLNYQALGRGLRQARQAYDYAVKKRKIRPARAISAMALISPTLDYSGFGSADLIIEAVIEDMKIKKQVFAEVSRVASPGAILASNTSCLSIAEISEAVKNKERVIGMHFFNPAHRMPLIEIIRADKTSDETVAALVEFSKKIGKTPIVVRDSCGFLVNRILLPYLNEAGFLLEDGVDIERIDRIMLKFGMPMGPLELIDEIGLDVGGKVAHLLEEHFGGRAKPPEILERLSQKKWFGKKAGVGFYRHKGKEKVPNGAVYGLLSKRKRRALTDEDILNRMLYKMINEAAMCLQEKVCAEPSDIDVGMIMGTGFPAFRAGLLRYADSIGADSVVDGMKRFREQTGSERFLVSDYLLDLAKKKKRFY